MQIRGLSFGWGPGFVAKPWFAVRGSALVLMQYKGNAFVGASIVKGFKFNTSNERRCFRGLNAVPAIIDSRSFFNTKEDILSVDQRFNVTVESASDIEATTAIPVRHDICTLRMYLLAACTVPASLEFRPCAVQSAPLL